MSPRKRVSRIPLASSPIGDFVRFLVGPGRVFALGMMIVASFTGAWYWGWQQVHGDVLTSPAYMLSPDQIIVTNRPDWMSFDIREKVFHNASLRQTLSIMDPDLNEQITAAFSLQPWVAKVNRVTKQYPARVIVDLEYRHPVCVVNTCDQLIPVDVEGVVLPVWDIPPSEIARYPRVECPDLSTPRGPVGEPWGDPRVVGAARIAEALGDRWRNYRLRQIEVVPTTDQNQMEGTVFRMRTHSHSSIIWGRAPGMEVPGEAETAEKLAYLDAEVRKYGNLEGPSGWSHIINLPSEIRNQRSRRSE